MKGGRFMLLVIFMNTFCCVLNILNGNVEAALGWGVAVIWSVRCHGQNMRIESMIERIERMIERMEGERGGDDDFKRSLD